MKKKVITGVWVVIIVSVAIAIIRPIVLDNARKVKFEDKRMGAMIASCSKEKSLDEFRVDNLDEVKDIDIRYTGSYDTLVDIEKCKQLEKLEIGAIGYQKKRDNEPGAESGKVWQIRIFQKLRIFYN